MDSRKIKLIIILVFIVITIFIVNKYLKNNNDIEEQNVEIVKVETENSGTEYQVKDKAGNTIITYEENAEGEGNIVYEIKDSSGKTIGTTEEEDEVRLYIDNPSYGEYAPSITE